MDVSQYLGIFIDETRGHLQELNEQILILEKEPENEDTINEIFRAAHSLKGMAGTMGYKRMQRLTHDMENVFSEIRNGKMKASPNLIDLLFRGLDALESYLDIIINTQDEGTEDNQDIIDGLQKVMEEGLGTNTPEAAQPKAPAAEPSEELKGRHFVLAEHELAAALKAKDEGENVFEITVFVQPSCILKAARAFLVFKALEEAGDIIKSVPEVQDIEDEKFDFDFSMVLLTRKSEDEIRTAVMNVSEIKDVVIASANISSKVGAQVPQQAAEVQENPASAAPSDNENQAVPAQPENNAPAQNMGGAAAAAQAVAAPAAAKQTAAKTASKAAVNRSVRVDIEKLDDLMNLVSELIIAKNGLVSVNGDGEKSMHDNGFNEQIEYLERVTTNLHQSVMKVRMVPIESVVNRFPRMIRDLSKKLGKKMDLYMTGEDTELDRTVIDEIGDPLMHLLRNAADHGLETNEERVRLGKQEVGSIFLDAYQEGNNVVIEVRDDGAGINVEKVKQKAITKGTITEEQAEMMSDKEIIDLLFRPSFSTAEVISDVSGRGVGLDVVKTKIEALGGSIEIRTTLGEGSNFIIRLPLTLAIIQTLMVEVGNEKYAIPLGSIETIEDIALDDVKYVQNKEVINLRSSVIPLIRLDKILDVEPTGEELVSLTVVIVKKGDKLAGLVVDNLIGQLEIVIKSIGKYINNSKLISGATILGDGEIALILDVNVLV